MGDPSEELGDTEQAQGASKETVLALRNEAQLAKTTAEVEKDASRSTGDRLNVAEGKVRRAQEALDKNRKDVERPRTELATAEAKTTDLEGKDRLV